MKTSFLVPAILVFWFVGAGCSRAGEGKVGDDRLSKGSSPPKEEEEQKKEKVIRAIFYSTDAQKAEFVLEVAATEAERAKGLMFRRSLEDGHGMLFVFEKEEVQTFWMKNTYIPLDMVFVNGNMEVVGVIESAKPLTEDTLSVAEPSLYVVEIKAYSARKHGIKKGTKVKFLMDAKP
jgi:uncharacterized membrane protein (UPF0127 family)